MGAGDVGESLDLAPPRGRAAAGTLAGARRRSGMGVPASGHRGAGQIESGDNDPGDTSDLPGGVEARLARWPVNRIAVRGGPEADTGWRVHPALARGVGLVVQGGRAEGNPAGGAGRRRVLLRIG